MNYFLILKNNVNLLAKDYTYFNGYDESVLTAAVKSQIDDLEKVQYLFEKKRAPIEHKTGSNNTLLHRAICFNKVNICGYLLKRQGIESIFSVYTTSKKTALDIAIEKNYSEIITLIFDYIEENSVLINWEHVFLNLIKFKASRITLERVFRHIKVEFRDDIKGMTPLLFAAHRNCIEAFDLLMENKASIIAVCTADHSTFSGMTILHLAHGECLSRILNDQTIISRFDINDQNNLYRYTPTHMSVIEADLKKLQLLIERGANLMSTDHEGMTLLHLAVTTLPYSIGKPFADYIIDQKPSILMCQDQRGMTALHWSIGKDIVWVEILLKKAHEYGCLEPLLSAKASSTKPIHFWPTASPILFNDKIAFELFELALFSLTGDISEAKRGAEENIKKLENFITNLKTSSSALNPSDVEGDVDYRRGVSDMMDNTQELEQASAQAQEIVAYQSGQIRLVEDEALNGLMQRVIANSFLEIDSLDWIDRHAPEQVILRQCANLAISDDRVSHTLSLHKDWKRITDQYGNNLYHWLGITGRVGLLKYFRENAIEFKVKNKFDFLPLHMAIIFNQKEAVHTLLPYYPAIRHEDICNVFYKSLSGEVHQIALNAFHLAIFLGRESIVTWYLDNRDDVDVHIPNFGNVFHLAIANGQTAIIQLLLNHDKIDVATLLGERHAIDHLAVIQYAAAQNRDWVVYSLIKAYRTNVRLRTLSRQEQDKSALVEAIRYGAVQSVQMLLDMNVDVLTGYHLEIERRRTDLEGFTDYYSTGQCATDARKDILVYIGQAIRGNYAKRYEIVEVEDRSVSNLVFQGGGIKGLAHVGAYRALCDLLPKKSRNPHAIADIERVAGTSAGAIFATAVALGFTPDQLGSLLQEAPFPHFLDDIKPEVLRNEGLFGKLMGLASDVVNAGVQLLAFATHPLTYSESLLKREGFSKGEVIMGWISLVFARHLLQIKDGVAADNNIAKIINSIHGLENAAQINIQEVIKHGLRDDQVLKLTFGQLSKLIRADRQRFKHLHAIALRLNAESGFDGKAGIEDINSEEEQWSKVLVIDAVRASMSIPLIFIPWQLRECNEQGFLSFHSDYHYVDGGILKNYPIELFDKFKFLPSFAHGNPEKPEPNPFTIGFRLFTPPTQPAEITGSFARLKTMAESIKVNIVHGIERATILGFLENMMNLYYQAEDILADFQNTHAGRTISISNCGISTTSFALSPDKQQELIICGEQAVCKAYHMPYEEYQQSQRTYHQDRTSARVLAAQGLHRGAAAAQAPNPLLKEEVASQKKFS